MPEATIPQVSARDRQILALALTPQLGPTRVRRLFGHIPRVEDIFLASLTELEATGLPAASAQAIALGNSLRLADEELKKLATVPGVTLVSLGSRSLSRTPRRNLRSSARPLRARRRPRPA